MPRVGAPTAFLLAVTLTMTTAGAQLAPVISIAREAVRETGLPDDLNAGVDDPAAGLRWLECVGSGHGDQDLDEDGERDGCPPLRLSTPMGDAGQLLRLVECLARGWAITDANADGQPDGCPIPQYPRLYAPLL